jgi:starch-binding outer membrane protein, SusD/RagB family
MKMMTTKNIIRCGLVGAIVSFTSCDSFFEVYPSADLEESEVFRNITRAQQFLNPAYGSVDNLPQYTLDFYTDNAVSNTGARREAASGSTAESSPVASTWNSAFGQIMHINEFLLKGFNVPYDAVNASLSTQLKNRTRGEAYGLRGYYKWVLLKNFAGPSANDPSTLLGFPIVNELITVENANQIGRGTYTECYTSIISDLDSAYKYIPIMRYAGTGDADGVKHTGRASRQMILALRARVALYAASPAYNQLTWQDAAKVIYDAIGKIDNGAIVPLKAFGNFDDTNNADDFWRSPFNSNATLESANFPPSLFGRGDCNPTQELVDAYPTRFGYPIAHPASGYNPASPYANRDPRFERFIFYNGTNNFPSSTQTSKIETFEGGRDAYGGLRLQATRTGYYMKKFLSTSITLDPSVSSGKSRNNFNSVFNRGALYLDFAEASFHAYGPLGKGPGMNLSAKDVLAAVRTRAGITTDSYMAVAQVNPALFLELIRNERRLELCFQGERYYDVRRWKLPLGQLNNPVSGTKITKLADGTFSYQPQAVEKRYMQDFMYYNPVPRNEVLKSQGIVQNYGW